jgi:hypothetical protein
VAEALAVAREAVGQVRRIRRVAIQHDVVGHQATVRFGQRHLAAELRG